jgi:hypothetical protein
VFNVVPITVGTVTVTTLRLLREPLCMYVQSEYTWSL